MRVPVSILGVDAGTVRIGLAIGEGNFSFPLEVVAAKNAVARIKQLIVDRNVETVIVGVPVTLRGEQGPEAHRVLKFIEKLGKAIKPCPIETVDERLTSKEADQTLSKKNRDKRDAVAAALLLDTWMSRRRL